MIYFSSLLQTNPTYKPAANRLFAALDLYNIKYNLINNTKDIWVRDFMPIKTNNNNYVSFRYEPCYLKGYAYLRTNFKSDLSSELSLQNIIYSDINLDGGNVVFSPSKDKVIISDRVYSENSTYTQKDLVNELEQLLNAQVIIIPSLKMKYDMTGHADGMVRFVDEKNVIGNRVEGDNSLEEGIKVALKEHGINVIDFPYFSSVKGSAAGCYLNYLETEKVIFLPAFGNKMDNEASLLAESIFKKLIVPFNINEIAKYGGVLNCISWDIN